MPRCKRCQAGEPHIIEHGTVGAYSYHGCRCGICADSQSARNASYREANADRIRNQQRTAYAQNRTKRRKAQRDRYYQTIDASQQRNRDYYYANRERLIRDQQRRDYGRSRRVNKQRDLSRQQLSKSRATRHGDVWTPTEDSLLLSSPLTNLELALQLRRSLWAVKGRRDALRNGRKKYHRRSATCANGHSREDGAFKLDSRGRYRCLQCLPNGSQVKARNNFQMRVPAWLDSPQDWDALVSLALEWQMTTRAARAYLRAHGLDVPDGRRTPARREAISRARKASAKSRVEQAA